jgi:hypothetical protein
MIMTSHCRYLVCRESVFGTYPPLSGSSGMTAHLAANPRT